MSLFRSVQLVCALALAAAVFVVAPSTALAKVEFQPAGNMTVNVFIDDDGELVGGAPANHHWLLNPETGQTPTTTTSFSVLNVDPLAGESYNGTAPSATGALATYGVCSNRGDGSGLDCEARNGWSFAQFIIGAGAGNDFLDASKSTIPVQLSGGDGSDLLIGSSAADYIVGGTGNDTIDGRCGMDGMFGSLGNDTLVYGDPRGETPCALHAAGVYVSFNGAADDVEGENINVPTNNFEAISGGPGGDVFVLNNAAPMVVAGNGGNDVIEARNGVADSISCGAGTDRAVVDAATVDVTATECEELERAAVVVPPTPGTPTPTPPVVVAPPVNQGRCPAAQKVLEVNGVRMCSDAQTTGAGGLVQLRGNVSIDGFLEFTMTGPLVVDVARRTATFASASSITARKGVAAMPVLRNANNGSFPLSANFTITSGFAEPVAVIGGVTMGHYDSRTGIITQGSVDGHKLQVTTGTGTVTYAAGAQFINRSLSAVGTAGFSRNTGIVTTVTGCLRATLPVGGASRIATLSNTCLKYSPTYDAWEMTASATLAGMLTSTVGARTVGGTEIDDFSMDFGSSSSAAGYNTRVDEGSIRVTGLRDPSKVRAYGYVGSSWTEGQIPGVSQGARMRVTGIVRIDAANRELNVNGTGTLMVGGQDMTSGDIDLTIRTGTESVPASVNANVSFSALQGFITGGATVTIDGSGFFAAGRMTVGFPAGAPITNRVNGGIESILNCDWGFLGNWCPTVTGWTISAEAAVSNKGVGARTSVSVLYGTFWWLGRDNSIHMDLGFGSSKQLVDALRSRAGRAAFVPEALQSGRAGLDASSGTTDTWTIPPEAKIASLQLAGSTTGELKVTDPTGRVVFDSAKGISVPGVGFGRDPKGTGRAAFGVFAPAIKAGAWTVSTAGAAPFTSTESLMSLPPVDGKVTKASVVGKPADTRSITSGVSKLKIAYSVPAGSTVSLRAATATGAELAGATTMPIATGRTKGGTVTWTVSKRWAGKLHLVAVTERDGIPVATEVSTTVFEVERAQLAAPKTVKVKRAKLGTVAAAWTPVKGATGYEVSMCVGNTRVPARMVTAAPRLTLTPRTALGLRLRVRATGAGNVLGRWSEPSKVTALPVKGAKGSKVVLKPTCKL